MNPYTNFRSVPGSVNFQCQQTVKKKQSFGWKSEARELGSQKNPPWFGLWSPHVDEPHLALKVARDLEGSEGWVLGLGEGDVSEWEEERSFLFLVLKRL